MGVSKNTFNKGLNKSTSKGKYQADNYYNATNLRVVTDNEGLSTGAIINIKGNDLAFTIPSTSPVYKLKANTIGALTTLNIYVEDIAPPISIDLSITSESSAQLIAEKVQGVLATQIAAGDIKVQYNNTEVYFIGRTNLGMTMNAGNPAVLTLVVPLLSNLVPIGYTVIRDEIILFTTNDITPIGGPGQIWKLTYDDTITNYTYTLTLLYNNTCNFSTYYPIRAEADYENSKMIGVPFTDDFNPLRFFNTEDPNSFAIDPNQLDVASDVFFDIPVLESIDGGGQLLDGVYQYAYRYSNFEGSQTPFSPCSAVINLNDAPESIDYVSYYASGPGNNTKKSIKIRVDNIDTRYEQIEFVSLYKASELGTPVVRSFATLPVTKGPIYVTNTGGENSTILTIEDVLSNGNPFTHCKDITVKDSRLIAVNTKNKKFVIDDNEFDARVYRFPGIQFRNTFVDIYAGNLDNLPIASVVLNSTPTNWTQTAVFEHGTNYSLIDTSTWALSATSNAITPLQIPNAVNNNFKFQSDGKTLGGEGKNISYKIGVENFGGSIIGDTNVASTVTSTSASLFGKGYRANTQNSGQIYTINGKQYRNKSFPNFTSAYAQANIKPYQHEETYRLAIRFWDKKGRKSFDKWMCDVTMPATYEFNGYGVLTDFNYSDTNGIFKILGFEFTVHLPQPVKDKISGYEIVRVERTQNDRTILGSGTMFFNARWGTQLFPTPNNNIEAGYLEGSIDTNTCTVQSPDFKLDNFPGYSVGDKLIITGVYVHSRYDTDTDYYYRKLYGENILYAGNNVRRIMTINQAFNLDNGVNLTGQLTNHGTFYNRRAADSGTVATNNNESLGNNTILLDFVQNIPNDLSSSGDLDKYHVYYYRPLTNQYGGNTYNARASNKYISTNHFRTITEDSGLTNIDQVFGGDIFLSIYDTSKLFKSWLFPTLSVTRKAYMYWMAVESYTNPEWRVNDLGFGNPGTINRTGVVETPVPDITVDTLAVYETMGTNGLYETSNNSKYNYSQPLNFLPININDNRIYASEIKFSGESVNSWSIFKTNSYRDVDSIYGPINAIGNLQNQTIFFQDKAFGVIPINLKTFVKDNSGAQILVSSGEVLSKHEYISSKTGSKHMFGVLYHEKGIDFFDINSMKMFRYAGEGLQCLSNDGLEQEFAKRLTGDIKVEDNPIQFNGISCIYDYKFNESIFTFKDTQQVGSNFEIKKFTIAYSDAVQGFSSFYSFTPGMYISNKKNIFTPDYDNGIPSTIYIHNIGEFGKFYNKYFKTDITILVNPEAQFTKTFDNLVLSTEVENSTGTSLEETIDGIQCINDYQDTTLLPLVAGTSIRRRFRTWTTNIPRGSQSAAYTTLAFPRMTDKYILITLQYTNNNNKRFIMQDIITSYRVIENIRSLVTA